MTCRTCPEFYGARQALPMEKKHSGQIHLLTNAVETNEVERQLLQPNLKRQ